MSRASSPFIRYELSPGVYFEHPLNFAEPLRKALGIDAVNLRRLKKEDIPPNSRIEQYLHLVQQFQGLVDNDVFKGIDDPKQNYGLQAEEITEVNEKIKDKDREFTMYEIVAGAGDSMLTRVENFLIGQLTEIRERVATQTHQQFGNLGIDLAKEIFLQRMAHINQYFEDLRGDFRRGLDNALEKCASVIVLIPQVFKRDRGRDITKKEYQSIVSRLHKMFTQFAKLKMPVLNIAMGAKPAGIIDGENCRSIENEQYFQIINTKDGDTIAPTYAMVRDTLVKARANLEAIKVRGPAIGCPAHYVRFNASKSMLDAFIDWIINMTNMFFFNENYEEIMSRPLTPN